MKLAAYIIVVLIIYVVSFNDVTADSCTFGEKYDFSALDGVPWDAENEDSEHRTKYSLSICKPLAQLAPPGPCKDQTAACSTASDVPVTIGNYPPEVEVIDEEGVVKLTYEGSVCHDLPDTLHKTVINFKCGKTLGSPIYLDNYACVTNFEWYTSVACKTPPTSREVKCYVYSNDGDKIDLQPLIKVIGGHMVTTTGSQDLFINVCRDITPDPDGDTAGCPDESGACRPITDNVINAGRPQGPLEVTPQGNVRLSYSSELRGDGLPAGCTNAPSTNITFACPTKGQAKKPMLLFDLDCYYEVVWETEYACPEKTLVSNTCKLNGDVHGVEIDLTPLKEEQSDKFRATGQNSDGSIQYTYWLSVCGGGLDIQCSSLSTGVASCQTSTQSDDKVLGLSVKQNLRYSDGDLVMTFKGGDKCHHSDFQRVTVINLQCDPNGGAGTPVFSNEDDCTYIFNWVTRYACVNVTEVTCQVEGGGHLYDLSLLTKEPTQSNWQAMRGYESGEDEMILLNVCEPLTNTGLAQLCTPTGGGACSLVTPSHWLNLGVPGNPYFNTDTGAVEIKYTGGGACGTNKQADSIIRFSCQPGNLVDGPVLVRKSGDKCSYEFEWATSAACAQDSMTGDDCQLDNVELGISFDLRPLTKTGADSFYEVAGNSAAEKFYINVCGKLSGSPCDDPSQGEIGACQVSSGNNFNTGLASDKLRYADGFLNLTYVGGDLYNSAKHVSRVTEIAFTCDETADPGVPTFFREESPVYSFRWLTKYACASPAIECIVTDNQTNTQYDLSSLSKSDSNWVTVDDTQTDGKRRTFYINVCRRLVAQFDGCSPEAGVCEVDLEGGVDKLSHGNLGAMATSPKLISEGQIELSYTGGEMCDSDNSRTFSTSISLLCDQTATTTSPMLMTIQDCQYQFEWQHAAACALGAVTPGPADVCALTDPTLDFTFNLKPLMAKDYTVTHGDQEFTIHVCGAVQSGSCLETRKEAAVCLGEQVLGSAANSLEYSESGRLSLTYQSGDRDDNTGDFYKVVIEFMCDQAAGVGSPRLQDKDGTVYVFRFDTAYACPPAPIQCETSDSKGNVYDLSLLAKPESDGNWEVIDTRTGHADLTYYINVCKPVNSRGDNFCSGAVGACQTAGSQSYNLGYLQGAPHVTEGGELVLTYGSGDKCHVGKDNESIRSTVITFVCAESQSDPVFVTETDACQYHFEWSTPAACPVEVVTGDDCKVTEPVFNTVFDLSSLTKVSQDYYKVTGDVYEYWLNVCEPLANPGDGCQGAASCQTKDNDQRINGGLPNKNLVYQDGEIRLVYTDGKADCHQKYERETIIRFTCDHEATTTDLPTYLSESPQCQYLFEWPTSLACVPRSLVAECSVRDSAGNQYDLTRLRSATTNYVYVDQTSRTKYLLNVCGNVIHGKEAACPPEAAVCAVKLDVSKNKYETAGTVDTSELKVMDGSVVLRYSEGRLCLDGSKGYTDVHFVCDPSAVDSQPELVDADDNCHIVFEWKSSVACPITEQAGAGTDCKVSNPQTGYEFDLSTMKGRTWTFGDDKDTHKFDLSVCEPLADSKCDSGTGSCQYESANPDKHWNSGASSDSLKYLDGILELRYTGGDLCNHNNQPRTTVVNFVCGQPGSGDGEPVFVTEDSDCVYFVYWHTELACEHEPMSCSLTDEDMTYDLSPLVLRNGHHSAISAPDSDTGAEASYYINVCRPLNPIPGVHCPASAAVCKATVDSAVSLGQAGDSPMMDEDGQLTVLYKNGDDCTATKQWSTKIIFTCEAGLSMGTPVLEAVNVDECLYVFSWPTNLACKVISTPDVDNDCRFTDARTKYTYDFSSLMRTDPDASYKVTTAKGSYFLNLCGKLTSSVQASECTGSAVCLVTPDNKGHPYGRPGRMSFVATLYNIKMNYAGGEDCNGTPREAHVLLQCDWGAVDNSVLDVSYEGDCSVVFVYKTVLACAPVIKDCVVAYAGAVFDLGPLSRETASWQLSDADNNYYWFNLCQGIHDNPVNCPRGSAVCWQSNGGAVSVLGTVQSQTMTVDAQGRVVLEYSGGKSCRAAGAGDTTVRIYLSCGTSGNPTVLPETTSDPCLFELEWNSVYACKEIREPLFPSNDVLTDPKTGLSVPLIDLTGGRTYSVMTDSFKYIIHLKGTPAEDSTDCLGMAVCRVNLDGKNHCSLGEASTATYFIKGEILEAHFSAPTVCEVGSAIKPSTIINFHCSQSNKTEDPTFVYKSKKGQYIFDWFTPGVCELAKVSRSAGGGNNEAAGSKGSGVNSAALGAVLGVSLTVLVFGGLVFLLYKPERRARVIEGVQRFFRRSRGYMSYSYSELNQTEDSSNSLLGGARETYGADTGTLGNIQAFHDDSDEDILQL